MGLEQIYKRASKRENAHLQSFATHDINPMNSFMIRHAKMMTYIALESTHNTLFHFVETVKVRGQARNIVSGDISHYFKNKVETKPLISGVISGFFGAAAGAATFMTVHDLLTLQFYCNTYGRSHGAVPIWAEDSTLLNRIQSWDFRKKNVLIFVTSDFFASLAKVQFEVRKQLIQMYSRDTPISQLAKATQLCWMPLMLRDCTFRAILLSSYYASTDVTHRPIQKYTMPQIVDFMKERRALAKQRGEIPETH